MKKKTKSLVLSGVLGLCLGVAAIGLSGCSPKDVVQGEDTFKTSITNPFNQVKKNRVFSLDGKTYAVRADALETSEELYVIDDTSMHLDTNNSGAPNYINYVNDKLYYYTVNYDLDDSYNGTVVYKFMSSDADGANEKPLIVLNLTQTQDSIVLLNGVHVNGNILFYNIVKSDPIGVRTELHKLYLGSNEDNVYYEAEQYCDVAYIGDDTYIMHHDAVSSDDTRGAFKIDVYGDKTPCTNLANADSMFGANGLIYFTSEDVYGEDYKSLIQTYNPKDDTVSTIYSIDNTEIDDFTVDGDTLYVSMHNILDDEDIEQTIIKSVNIGDNGGDEKVIIKSECPFMDAETDSVSYKSLIKIDNKLYFENVYHDIDETPSCLGVLNLDTGKSTLFETK